MSRREHAADLPPRDASGLSMLNVTLMEKRLRDRRTPKGILHGFALAGEYTRNRGRTGSGNMV